MQTKVGKNDGRRTSYVWLPYIVLSTYILFTMLISMFGPIEYPNYTAERKFVVVLYMGAFLVITWIGMLRNAKYKSNDVYKKEGVRYRKTIRCVSITITIVMIIKLLLLASSISMHGVPTFTSVLRTLAQVYTDLHREEPIGNIYRQIDSLTTFLSYIATIGGLFVWKDLRNPIRFFLVIALLADFTYDLFYVGTQRGIFSYVIYAVMIYVVAVVRKKGSFRIKNVIFASLIVLMTFFIFSNILDARLEYWGSTRPLALRSGVTYNLEHPLLWIFPDRLKYQMTAILSYPTQGYYGLSLCLAIPFEWTYGIGASRGLNSVINQVIPSIPIMIGKTYPLRAEAVWGYSGLANWHTIFPWLASDLTFLGALLYMGFVARIYMKCWKQVIEYNNPISFVLLTLLTVQYIFVPANNQLFISRGDAVGTIVVFFTWLARNRKHNFVDL